MVKLSERTKTCRARKWIFTLLHWLALIGPFLYWIPYIFVVGDVGSKVVIGLAAIVSVIFCLIALVIDVKHRAGLHKSAFWSLIAACVYGLQSLSLPFILIMAGVSILDECVFIPIKDHYAAAQLTNTEIDRRAS